MSVVWDGVAGDGRGGGRVGGGGEGMRGGACMLSREGEGPQRSTRLFRPE